MYNVYCPRCNKTISDERMQAVTETLRKLGNSLLSEGKCPVCGTELLKISLNLKYDSKHDIEPAPPEVVDDDTDVR
ncbi:MAG: hypothetical protein M1117_01520 [Candidatus Thermoplasmatota archaeon]|nr:hypothetical protein [Candidatus Thermoplasmatota archaeon]